MTKDIWHRYDEAPKHQDIIMTDTGCWAYRADLFALDTENKDLSDKIGKLETELERTRKALDVAIDALETFARIPQPIAEVAKVKLYAIKEITALEQKEE